MFGKILVCLDGSDLAEQILPHVYEVARCSRFGSKIVLLQVIKLLNTMLVATGGGLSGAAPYIFDEAEKEARSYLERVAQPLQGKGLV